MGNPRKCTEWHKKTGTFEKSNKNWRNPRKKKYDRNWIITTCLLRDSNPYYHCLKITSCRWRSPPRTHSFTATTHFKSSRSFVSPCITKLSSYLIENTMYHDKILQDNDVCVRIIGVYCRYCINKMCQQNVCKVISCGTYTYQNPFNGEFM